MLNSVVLEVATGLIFTFLAVSLATSAIVEAIASATQWRSRTLLSGVKDLVNDPNFTGLARQLYGHALVNPRGPGSIKPKKNMPAYIDSKRFAAALLDVAGLTKALTTKTLPDALEATVNANVARVANPQINALLRGAIQRGQGDFEAVKNEIAAWFDTGMDRVSGAYKRWSQYVSLIVALILCVLLNIDAVYIGRTLWVTPGIAAKLQATQNATVDVKKLLDTFPVGWPNSLFIFGDAKQVDSGNAKQVSSGDAKPEAAVAKPPVPDAVTQSRTSAIVGWLIAAFATLFGAPFWFDALQSVVRLKGAGPGPNEKAGNKAAAA